MEINISTEKVLRTIWDLGMYLFTPLIIVIMIAGVGELPKTYNNFKLLAVIILVLAFFVYDGLYRIRIAIEEKKERDQ